MVLLLHLATSIENTKYKINDIRRQEWMAVKILVIDEISYAKQMTLEELDKQLRRLKSEPHKPYGGVHIIFIGDFHQLVPGLNGKDAIYSKHCIQWHQWINAVFFLKSDHRFVDDPQYGKLVERFGNVTVIREDIQMINSQLIDDNKGNGGNIHLPKEDTSDMYYACAVNTERNSITTSIFKDYINIIHPKEGGNFDLTEVPKNAVIIESAIFDKKNERCSASFETKVYSKCGDADVMTSRNKHIGQHKIFSMVLHK